MSLCILCNVNPPIENSHVVPNFVVRRLKAGTPHRTLRHSNDLSRVEQDGWKGPYLCAGCEGKFSKSEDSFCREIYDPLLKGGVQTFALREKSALFAVSLHFRCMHFAMDLSSDKVEEQVLRLYQKTRAICSSERLSSSDVYSYAEILKPITDATVFPPGINTYFFETIDAMAFPWVLASGSIAISYVKIPGIAFFLADADLDKATSRPGIFDPYRFETGGTLEESLHRGHMIQMIREDVTNCSVEIQRSYGAIPERQLAKMIAKIEAEPNQESFRGHQSFLLDKTLLEQVVAAERFSGPSL